jgi:hypothetical protein
VLSDALDQSDMRVEPILTVGIIAGQEGAPSKANNDFLLQSKGFYVIIAHKTDGMVVYDNSVPIYGQGKDKGTFKPCYSSTTISHQSDACELVKSSCNR